MKKKWLIPTLIASAALLLIGGFALAYFLFSKPTVVVPDLRGKTLSQAWKAVESVGLRLEIDKEVRIENVPPGLIISQDPEQGEKTKEGGTVRVVMSKGLATVKVPSVVGKVQDEAESTIRKASLDVGKIEMASSDSVPNGSVISQSPKAGANVEKGSAVDIVVSQGSKASSGSSQGSEAIRVPDVVNRTSAEATSILENAGFKVSRFDDYSETVPGDYVIRQTPEAGEKAKKGSTVTIAVSKGPKTVQLIDLRGKLKDDAVNWLSSHYLKANAVSQSPPTWGVASHVWDQYPAPGTTVDNGSTVTIKYAPP